MARAAATGKGPHPDSQTPGADIAGPWVAGADLPPLSKAVELMWGLAPAATRGPRRGLSVDQVVETAIELADEEGFEALSMNRIAERLGFTAMSLYRYVDSKATLLEVALDRVIGSPPEIPPGTPWRAALELWAREEYRVISRHSAWLNVRMSTPPLGPNNMAWLEMGLATLAKTRLPEPLKLQLVLNLSFYIIGRARLADEIKAEEDEAEGDWGIVDQLDPARFPALTTAVRARAFEQDDQQWATLFFDTGLKLLLDGYEQLIESYEE